MSPSRDVVNAPGSDDVASSEPSPSSSSSSSRVSISAISNPVREVRTEHGQFLELQAEGLDAPRAGFAEAVEGDPQKPEVIRVEVIDDDAGDMGNPPRLLPLPKSRGPR